jgi:hypothetical protein
MAVNIPNSGRNFRNMEIKGPYRKGALSGAF